MALVYKLTNGSIDVQLINHGLSGLVAGRGGLVQGAVSPEAEFTRIYPDGAMLSAYGHQPALENWKLHLLAGSGGPNEAAFQLQKLYDLLRQAREYQLTPWQTTPVWIETQAQGEFRGRYAIVYGLVGQTPPNIHALEFSQAGILKDLQFTIAREPFWVSHQPKTAGNTLTPQVTAARYPHTSSGQDTPFSTLWPVANVRHSNAITHIFNYDANLTAFSANLVAEDDFEYWVVSGSTPAAGDIIYFGSTDGPFFNLVLKLADADMPGLEIFMEYYTGTWDRYNDGDVTRDVNVNYLKSGSGPGLIKFNGAPDWTAVAVNGVTAHWLRLRITALTSTDTVPAQDGQKVFTAWDNFIEWDSGEVAGDEPAPAQIRMHNLTGDKFGSTAGVNWIMAGLKTRGLDNFIGHLNAGGDNPNWWDSMIYGDDTTAETDGRAPGGQRAEIDFATNQDWNDRVEWRSTDVANFDMRGDYRIFARVRQINGSVDDVSTRLVVYNGPSQVTGEIKKPGRLTDLDLLDLGIFRFWEPELLDSDVSSAQTLRVVLQAKAVSATPDLYVYDLILIPVDEWSATISGTHASLQNLSNQDIAVLDGGVERRAATKYVDDVDSASPTPQILWEVNGELPALPPGRTARLYFLQVGKREDVHYFLPETGSALAVQVDVHERWQLLRGYDGLAGLSG